MTSRNLKLYEEILLLALDDDAGTIEMSTHYTYAMSGAILAELAMSGAVTIADGKKTTVTLGAGATTQTDPILSEALAMVRDAKKPKQAKEWVLKFAGIKDLRTRAAGQLVARGILAREQDPVLIIFSRTVYPERDGGPERELRQRLHDAVFTDTADVAPRTVVILALLLKSTNMLNKVLGKGRVKERKERIEALTSGELVGRAAKEAVQGMTAAIVCCAVMPAVFVATN